MIFLESIPKWVWTLFLHTVNWFPVLLYNSHNLMLFVCTRCLFYFTHIWDPISEPGSNGNEAVLYISQSSYTKHLNTYIASFSLRDKWNKILYISFPFCFFYFSFFFFQFMFSLSFLSSSHLSLSLSLLDFTLIYFAIFSFFTLSTPIFCLYPFLFPSYLYILRAKRFLLFL